MSISKRAVILAVVGLGAAVVTALAAVGPEPKRDRGIADGASTALPEHVCPQEPWPFGCQWHEPTSRVAHKSHPSHSQSGKRAHTSRRSAPQLTAAEGDKSL
jgi:hypothetical protein